jgi:spore coat polysaccharide biosynthesis predicted glycosyltransferase SpsG
LNKSIFFRFEINKKVGSGHAVRCLRIAEFFKKKKFNIYLIISNTSLENLKKNKINISNNFKILKIKDISLISDAKNTINSIKNLRLKSQIYIFKDIYRFGLKWDNMIMREYSRLIILDDFFNKKHNCKIYINYNPYRLNQITYSKKKNKIFSWS